MGFKTANIFHLICFVLTFSMIGYWIYKFTINDSIVALEYKNFYETREDVYPLMSLCFKNPFKKDFENKTDEEYDQLMKEYSSGNTDLKEYDIEEDDKTFDISEYLMKYWVMWRDGKNRTYEPYQYKWTPPKVSYYGYWSGRFFKCFSIEIPEKNIKEVSIQLNNDIFPGKVRPTHWGFLVLLHYPNQLLLPSTSKQYIWDPQPNQNTYELRIFAKNSEILWRRKECLKDWENYDGSVIDHHIEKRGCRPFYQKSKDILPLCKDNKDIINISQVLSMNAVHGIKPPCKATEKVNYKFEIFDMTGTEWESEGQFWCTYVMQDTKFKVNTLNNLRCCRILWFNIFETMILYKPSYYRNSKNIEK